MICNYHRPGWNMMESHVATFKGPALRHQDSSEALIHWHFSLKGAECIVSAMPNPMTFTGFTNDHWLAGCRSPHRHLPRCVCQVQNPLDIPTLYSHTLSYILKPLQMSRIISVTFLSAELNKNDPSNTIMIQPMNLSHTHAPEAKKNNYRNRNITHATNTSHSQQRRRIRSILQN